MDARIAPLLGRCTRSMPRAPGRQPTIVGGFQILHGDARSLCFLRQTSRVREKPAELHRVGTGLPLPVLVRFESNVRFRVSPIHGAEFQDLLASLRGLLPCKARIILVGP